jgi:hypothetical protein
VGGGFSIHESSSSESVPSRTNRRSWEPSSSRRAAMKTRPRFPVRRGPRAPDDLQVNRWAPAAASTHNCRARPLAPVAPARQETPLGEGIRVPEPRLESEGEGRKSSHPWDPWNIIVA